MITIKDNKLIVSHKKFCDFCGEPIHGEENSTFPVKKDGKCCDTCFFDVVLPARVDGAKSVKAHDSLQDLDMLIESEKEAIDDYTRAISNSGDGIEIAIYKEILQDERDHLAKLEALKKGYENSEKIR